MFTNWLIPSMVYCWRNSLSIKSQANISKDIMDFLDTSAYHLFNEFSEVRRFWNSVGLPVIHHGKGVLIDWFFANLCLLMGDDLCKFAMFCWGIWYNRNQSVWKGGACDLFAMKNIAMSLWQGWWNCNNLDSVNVASISEVEL
nr:uncharacterized protein LOC109170919 [Ipomoea batatas]